MRYKFARKAPVIPYAVFLILFVILPILIIIYYAFTDAQGYFSFESLVEFFTNTTKLDVLFVSLLIGFFNTSSAPAP